MEALELLKIHGLVKEGGNDLIIKTDNGREYSLITMMDIYADRKCFEQDCKRKRIINKDNPFFYDDPNGGYGV